MKDLQKAFQQFDTENPHVWELFIRFTFEAMDAGHTRLSASLIIERIRWETAIVTKTDDKFKIANAHRAYYARKFQQEYPIYKSFFKTKRLRSKPQELSESTNF